MTRTPYRSLIALCLFAHPGWAGPGSGRPATSAPPGAELAITDARPAQGGPVQPEAHVPIRAVVRNGGRSAANVAVAIPDGRAPGGVASVSPPARLGPGQTGTFEVTAVVDPRHVRAERYTTHVVLLDADVPAARGVLARTWRDGDAANNARDVTLDVPEAAFDVSVRITRVDFRDICFADPHAVDRWSMQLSVFRGLTGAWSRSLNLPERQTGPRTPPPAPVRWPASGGAEVADGRAWTPGLEVHRPAVTHDEYLFLYVAMFQDDGPHFHSIGVVRPDSARLVLSPEQWHRGGTFTAVAEPGSQGCHGNNYTVTFQVVAGPTLLR